MAQRAECEVKNMAAGLGTSWRFSDKTAFWVDVVCNLSFSTMSKSNKTGTARWNHFESAVEYSVQRSAHKWTFVSSLYHTFSSADFNHPRFEQFEECFPLYAEEDRNGAKAAYRTVSDYIENETTVRPRLFVSSLPLHLPCRRI